MRRGLLTLALAAVAFGATAAQANAAAPQIVNSTSWLESLATSGESADSGNQVRVTVLVQHDPGATVDQLVFDDDWDGTNDPTSVKTNLTTQKMNIAGGADYTRISYQYQIPTSNTGMSCPAIGTRTRRTDNRNIRLRVRTSDGQFSSTLSNQIKFVATGQCIGSEDFAYIWGWSQSATQINPGQSVTFNYSGDDPDTSGDSDFNGIRYRLRRLSDGFTTGTTLSCPNNGDNAAKSVNITFPDRGRWVVEAELMDGGGCNQNQNGGYWFWIGAVDVNTAQSASPEVDLTGVARPSIGQTFNVVASVNDTEDSGDGGRVQNIEWDLNENAGDGVNGYESGVLNAPDQDLSVAERTRSINTTGMTPGNHTVRTRVTDNGAIASADSIRRQATDTFTFTVDTPPVAAAQTKETDADNAVNVVLTGTDVDADPLTYSVTQPSNGTVTGSGTNRTYTPNAGFAGTDSFTYTVNDGFGGTDTETITVKVYPRTSQDNFPGPNHDENDPHFEFSSQAGTTFECKLDTGLYEACSSPKDYTDLADGDHTVTVKATAGTLVERTPVPYTFNIDTTLPVSSFGPGLPADPTNSRDAHFEWTTTDANAVTHECRIDGGAWDDCTSPQDLTDVQDGAHSFEVQATDAAGNVEDPPLYHEWNVDATPPNTEFDITPPASTQSSDADFQWDSDDDNATYECKLDAGDWETCVPQNEAHLNGFTEGDHTFSVRGTDPLGNVETDFASFTWEVDTTAPETTIDVAPADPTNNNDPHFEFSSDDPTDGTFQCRLDGGSWESCNDGDADYTDVGDGDHTFEVAATDAAGNADATPDSHEWEIDTTAPQTLIDVAPPARTTATSATFAWSSSEADGATFQCRLDGETLAPCAGLERTVSGLADGSHTFEVVATDDAGNTDASSATHTWEVDTTAPSTTLTARPAPFTADADATFVWTSDDSNADYQCRLDNSAWSACDSPHELTNLSEDAHLFEVRGVDDLGNTETTPEAHLWLVDQTEPETVIEDGPADPTNSTTASFEVTSPDQPFIDRVECRIDSGAWSSCVQPPGGTDPWTRGYTGLSDGEHTFEARTIDRAGKVDSTPAAHTWNVDTDPPAVTFGDTPDTWTQDVAAHFEYSSDEAGSTYKCKLDSGAYEGCGSTSDLETLSEGPHSFSVFATDPAGNDSPVVTHNWNVDLTAPETTVDSGPDEITNENEATFTFSSSQANSTFECKLDTDAVYAPCDSGDTFTGIADGDRTLSVVAIDPAGNSDQTPATFAWNIDHTAPIAEFTDVEDSPTQNRDPSFSFTSDDQDAAFECQLEGGGWDDCTSPFAPATGLADGDYTFEVRATDPRDNVSDVVSHDWTIDNVAPETDITTEPTDGKLNQRTFNFEFDSNEDGTFECAIDSETPVECNGGTFETPELADGNYVFTVKATDEAGNQDTDGDTSTFEVDATAPETELTDGPDEDSFVPSDEAAFEFTGSDSNTAVTFECQLDGGGWNTCTSPHTESSLADQEHTFEVRAKDEFGNVDATPPARTWTVDTTDPTVSLTTIPDEDSTDDTPTFEWTGSNDVDFFECSVDGAPFSECESPNELDLEDGEHDFAVRATDHAGNVSDEATHDWTIDTVAPVTILNEVAGTPAEGSTVTVTSADFEFSGTDDNAITFECDLNGDGFEPCTSPENLTGLADREHTFTVRAKDEAGNLGNEVSRTWTVDTVGPEVTFTTTPSDPSNDETPVFDWTAETGATYECKLDTDAGFSACDPGDEFTVSAGDRTLLVHATDTHNNVGPDESYEWTVDLTDPTTSITNGPADGSTIASADATFEFESPSDANADFECKLDSGDWEVCTSPEALADLDEGERTFRVRAIDAAGNKDDSEETRTWTVDTTAPDTTITSNREGPVQDRDVQITFDSDDDNATYECQLTPLYAWQACDDIDTISETNLVDGDYSFEVRATDAVNNVENPPAKVEWTVDNAAPDTTIDSGPDEDSTVASDEATFTFSSDPGSGFECTLDGGSPVDCDPGTFTEDGLGEGEHTFTVAAIDAAGNADPSPAERTWNVDTTAPSTTIDTDVPAFLNSRDATIAFSSGDNTATFECQEDGETAAWTTCASPHVLATASADGGRSFRVRARDAVGNVDASPAEETWTVDTAAPAATIDTKPAALTNDNDAAFAFSSNEATGAEFDCKLDTGAFEACDSGNRNYADVSDGPHTFTVKTTDRAGNTSADEAYTWTVDTDKPGVTIDAGPNGLVNSDAAHFEYTRDDGTATLECKLDGEAFGACDSTTAHDENDLTDGEHTFVVKATDLAGNTDDATRTWTVDTAAPNTTIDSGPADASTTTTASFTFSSENGASFECKLDTGDFGACTSPKEYTGLATGSHTFQVRAKDTAGNADASPAERTWTIASAPIDTNPGGQNPDGQNPGGQVPPGNNPGGGGEPQPQACRFAAPGPGCGPAALTAKLTPKKAGAPVDVTLTGDGKGVQLKTVTFTLPRGLTLTAVKKARGKSIGSLTYTTLATHGAIAPSKLTLPKKPKRTSTVLSAGGAKVTVKFGKAGKVTLTGLPAGVTKVKLVLKGKRTGLATTAKRCGSLNYSAAFTDQVGGKGSAKATDTTCKKQRGSRR